MRWLKDIPHERYKIQILQYNGKYIVKIELAQFEQIFKIGETDVYGLEDIEKMVNDELLKNSLNRFLSMREDWSKAFEKKNSKHE